MEQIQNEQEKSSSQNLLLCPMCHQKVLQEYYFCPNCGKEIRSKPLPTDALSQGATYALSIIIPLTGFIFISKWPGAKYFKSSDPKARRTGAIAWIILLASTIFTIWFAYYLADKAIQSSLSSLNADLGGF